MKKFVRPDIVVERINSSRMDKDYLIINTDIRITNNDQRKIEIKKVNAIIKYNNKAIARLEDDQKIVLKAQSDFLYNTDIALPSSALFQTMALLLMNQKIVITFEGFVVFKVLFGGFKYDFSQDITISSEMLKGLQ
ncbi:LEA type 2 family protein [Spirochaetota bacterium]